MADGTVSPGSASYNEQAADRELYGALLRDEYFFEAQTGAEFVEAAIAGGALLHLLRDDRWATFKYPHCRCASGLPGTSPTPA